MHNYSYLDREPIRNRPKYGLLNGRLRIMMHIGTFIKSSLNIHYSKNLEEQTFDIIFFSLVRMLDILGVAR